MIAYQLRDAAGVLAAIHERHDGQDGSKRFVWRRPDGAVGLNGTPIADLPLYGVDQLGAESIVVIVEGEKSRDALAAVGIPAVGTVTGASSTPGRAALAELTGRAVAIWADRDEPGRGHMSRIAATLEKVGAASVAWIDWPDAPPHGDAADFLAAGGTYEDVVALIHAAHEPPRSAGQPDDADDAGPIWRAPLIVGIDDYRAGVPVEIPWICRPIAYSGGVTLIAGPPKAGKSTLAAQLQHCRETGAPFLGTWPVQTGPVLLVTEEGGVAVVYKTNGLHALDVLDRRAAAGLTFAQVLAAVAEWGAAHPGGLAFIDTLAIWADIENENDAAETSRAVALAAAVAQSTDLAIVLVHHARKSGGENGEAIRGSGAILATVDIAAELSRVSPGSDDRWLDVQGRVILPERYLLTFDRATLTYSLGDRAEARLDEIEADLVRIPVDGPGLIRNELRALWQRDPRARAEQLVNVGRLRTAYVKTGRAWAWRYWSIPAVWTPPMRTFDD